MITSGWPIWLQYAKEFQTAIWTFVGFLGVCLTLGFNAWLQRQQRAKEIANRRAILRNVLRSELHAIAKQLRQRERFLRSDLEDESDDDAFYHELRQSDLTAAYDASIADLGLLTSEEAIKLVSSYTEIKDRIAITNSTLKAFQAGGTIATLLKRSDPRHAQYITATIVGMKCMIDLAVEASEILLRHETAPQSDRPRYDVCRAVVEAIKISVFVAAIPVAGSLVALWLS